MSKVQSDTLYKDIEVLKGKLLSVKGEMSDDLYTLVEAKIKVAEEMIINLPEEATVADLVGITTLISELEVRYLDDKAVKEMSDTSKRKSFLAQLETVERNVELNAENAEEYMVEAREYWERIRNAYDKSQQTQIIEKMTSIHLKCILEKAKIKKEVDMSKMPSFEDFGECRAIIDLLTEKRDGMDDMSRVTLELWLDKIVDKDTGGINKEEIKSIILREKFWEILSGSRGIGLINGEEPQNAVMDVQNNVDPEMEYEEKLKALAKEYDVNWKKLKTKENEVAFIVEGWRGKYKVEKVRRYPLTGELKFPYGDFLSAREKEELRLKTVAVVLNDNIDSINKEEFFNFRKLNYVILPCSLKSIEQSAFMSSGITSITMPNSLRSIESEAFGGCNNLKEITLNEGLKEIGPMAFRYSKITSVTMPSSLKSIEDNAFYGCKDLRDVRLNEGLEEIGSHAFDSSGITSITMPSSLERIEDYAFYECKDLRDVRLNEGLRGIGAKAFSGTGIIGITMPRSLKSMEDSAFCECEELREVSLNKGLRKIGRCAFAGCSSLETVELNENLGGIDSMAFYNTKVNKVKFPPKLCNIGLFVFPRDTEIEVDQESFAADVLKSSKRLEELYINEDNYGTYLLEGKMKMSIGDYTNVSSELNRWQGIMCGLIPPEELVSTDKNVGVSLNERMANSNVDELRDAIMAGTEINKSKKPERYLVVEYGNGKIGFVRASDGKEIKPARGSGGNDR